MGRNKTNSSRDFFTYNKAENKSICNICETYMNGDHAGNLERHLKRHHGNVFENFVQQKKKIMLNSKEEFTPSTSSLENLSHPSSDNLSKSEFLKVKLNREIVLKACVELITVNGCPFEFLDCSGFRKLLNPILTAVDNSWTLNSENIKLLISETAFKIVSRISKAVEKRMICLKIDTATRSSRSVLGINAQLIADGKVNLFTLGMIELKDKHAGICMRNMIEKVLEKYGIDVGQIYSIVVDNCDGISFDSELGNETEEESSVAEIDTKDHFLEDVFFGNNFAFTNLVGVKCVVHALHLAIENSIKNADLNEFLSEARELVRKLRIPSLLTKFKDFNIKKPVLDCPTRWRTTYRMLKSLLDCKDFILFLAESNLDYYFAESKWVTVNLVVDTLQPLTEAASKLQSEQLTLSDFYGIWIECKLKLKNLKNLFADILFSELSRRELLLLENESLLGAVYLDPRFKVVLSTPQKVQAVHHLKNIWNKLLLLKETVSIKMEKAQVFSETSREKPDDLEEFLRSKELAMETRRFPVCTEVDIEFMLENFDHVQRIDSKKNVLEFWEENRTTYPHLYKIAVVVLATPATQVSVERAFSGLKFILKDNRNSLSKNILEDILIIRSNFNLFQL